MKTDIQSSDEGFCDSPSFPVKCRSPALLPDKLRLRPKKFTKETLIPKRGPMKAWQEDAFELLEKAGGHQTDNLSALAKESLFIRFDPLLQDVASPLLKERARKAAEALREEAAKQDKGREVEDIEQDLMSMSSPAGVGDATFVRTKKAPVSKNLLSQFGDSNTQSQQTGSLCTSWLSSVSQYNEQDMLSSRDSLEDTNVTENTITQSKSDDSGAIVATPNGLSQVDIDRVRQEVMLEMKGEMLAQTKDYESKLEEYRKKEQEWDQVTEYQYNVLTNLTNALEAKDAEVLQAAEDVQRFERALSETTSLYSELKLKYQDVSMKNISLTEQLRELQILLQERMNKYDKLTEEADDKVNQVQQDFEALESDKNKEIELLMKKIRMMEMKESSLQNELAQKKKDLDELARICDELISKGRTS
ncbi:DgyrCDS12518 [Dimorphilus gyrociliatus]|uniref:DgyrCDS12518 n=1 Tax=Dimorphilus gyrociliatus TaxID=2664684 RepID=A0A7I8W6R0_9ANNE|nr:DgyrCDS12518 [Dimorphilus gyrociliatus]